MIENRLMAGREVLPSPTHLPIEQKENALQPRDRLIVALDVPSAEKARRLVSSLGETVGAFKIGKQLFTAEGPGLLRELVADGHKIFLDLKFHDIPNTVAGAVRAASALGVSMLTV